MGTLTIDNAQKKAEFRNDSMCAPLTLTALYSNTLTVSPTLPLRYAALPTLDESPSQSALTHVPDKAHRKLNIVKEANRLKKHRDTNPNTNPTPDWRQTDSKKPRQISQWLR